MGGGCYSGPEGTTCWGDWWVGLVFLAILLGVAILLIAAVIKVASNPAAALRYYGSKRSLVVLPLTFLGYMAFWITGQWLVWQFRLSLWATLLLGAVAVSILLLGAWAFRRLAARHDENTGSSP